MELSFDIRGNLEPYQKIEIEFEELKNYFSDRFENSVTRKAIFDSYAKYLIDFQKEVTPNFVQWIDGSFITNKENPNDIDFVNLIDFDIYEKNEQIIEVKFRKYGAKNNYPGVDAYFVKVYSEEHDKSYMTEFDLVYWRNWFTETKKNRMKKKFPKGFVEIKFGTKN
ncbi:MAG: hypothetical protein KDC85_00905 [Saprospiraceae bacterium]|nr:hypothetical protein [Saprospiraceae bacterium]MCB9326892.1 hypothetical protein [Lewinellaceae bacterium]